MAGWHPGSSYPAVSVWRGTRGPVGTEAVFTTASEAGTLKKKKKWSWRYLPVISVLGQSRLHRQEKPECSSFGRALLYLIQNTKSAG